MNPDLTILLPISIHSQQCEASESRLLTCQARAIGLPGASAAKRRRSVVAL